MFRTRTTYNFFLYFVLSNTQLLLINYLIDSADFNQRLYNQSHRVRLQASAYSQLALDGDIHQTVSCLSHL